MMNIELFKLIWLDKFVDSTEENRQIQNKLRSKIYSLTTFDNSNDFVDLIRNESKDRFVLIVSGQYGRDIIETVHNLNKIVSIFVFCGDKQLNRSWADKYPKIKSVVVEIDELLSEIDNELNSDEQFVNETIQLSNERNEIISLIYQIKPTINDQRLLLNICFDYFKSNLAKLKQVYEFEHFYSNDKCLHWFFIRTFLYELLKKSLQSVNIEMIYLLRFFFQDLDQQIKQSHIQSQTFYKGQILTSDQIQYLAQLNPEQLFYFHNYLVLNGNQDKTVDLLTNLNHLNGLHKVLFRIQLNNKFIGKHQNYFLLPILTSFKLISMKFEKRIWFVDVEVHGQELFENDVKDPIDLANYLFDECSFDESQQMYLLLLKSYPNLSSKIYHQLGLIEEKQGFVENSLEFHLKSIDSTCKDDVHRSHYLNHIGILYDQLKDYPKALHFYFQSLKRIANEEFKMRILNNIAITYANQKQFEQSLKYFERCLDLQQKHQFKYDFIHNTGGWIYFYFKQYQQAVQQFRLALQLTQSTLSKGIILQNLAFLYENTNERDQSLEYYQQSLDCFQQFNSTDYQRNIQFIQQHISKLKQ